MITVVAFYLLLMGIVTYLLCSIFREAGIPLTADQLQKIEDQLDREYSGKVPQHVRKCMEEEWAKLDN